jgi:hypothetical protein
MVLRFFERLDTLEKERQAQKEVNELLLAYIDAGLVKALEPAAKALAEKLREIIKK